MIEQLTILGITVDALSLSLTPADAPSAVLCRCRDWHDASHVVLAKVCELEHQHATHGTTNNGSNLLDPQIIQHELEDIDVVSDRGQRKFGAVVLVLRVAVLAGDRAGASVWTAQAVEAADEEARHVERLAGSAEQRSPPVANIGAAGQGVADDHGIVAIGRQRAVRLVCYGHIVQCDAALERVLRDDGELLFGNELGIWILGLGSHSFCQLLVDAVANA